MHGDFTYFFNVIGLKTFGHKELIELINSLVGHHELVELNCLVGLIKFFKLSELIVKYHNGDGLPQLFANQNQPLAAAATGKHDRHNASMAKNNNIL